MNVCVLIPTKNEEKSIGPLVTEIISLGHKYVVVVDDSTDNTKEVASAAGATVIDGCKKGLGSAIRLGMCIARAHEFRYVVVFDAGMTHNPKMISQLLAVAKNGYGLVIASRFIKTDYKHQGFRTGVSLWAANLVRCLWGIDVHDATAGFRCYDLEVFDRRVMRESFASGHAVQLELLALGRLAGCSIAEAESDYAPLTNSTFSFKSVLEAVWVLYRMFVLIVMS